MSDEVIAPLIELAERIVKMAKEGGATVAECIARHVEGSGRHILEHMRANGAARAG